MASELPEPERNPLKVATVIDGFVIGLVVGFVAGMVALNWLLIRVGILN